MFDAEKLERAARARIEKTETVQGIRNTLKMVRQGRPLAAETDPKRLTARLMVKANVSHQRAKVIAEEIKRAPIKRLGAEAIQGDSLDFVPVCFLEKGVKAARAVARVRTPTELGTGFMVSEDLFVTNNHVIPSAEIAAITLIEFEYETDLAGLAKTATVYTLDPKRFFMTDAIDKLDFTLVAIGKKRSGSGDLKKYSYCALSKAKDKHALGEVANIIQHPQGRLKEIVLRENRLAHRTEDMLHYIADTEGGSSGSPVFNNEWQVIALHHWGGPSKAFTDDMGKKVPQQVNEGIRASRIVAAIEERAPAMTEAQRDMLRRAQKLHGGEGLLAPEIDTARHGLAYDATLSPDGVATVHIPIELSLRIPMLGHAAKPDLPAKQAGPTGSNFGQTLDAAGYAKIIVTLKTGGLEALALTEAKVSGTDSHSPLPQANTRLAPRVDARKMEAELQDYFIVPGEARTSGLAAASPRSFRHAPRDARSKEPRKVRVFPHLALAVGYVDRAGVMGLAADSRVASFVEAPELSLIRPVGSRPAKARWASWGIKRLGIERLWQAGFDGEGVVVGHLDTGIDGSHPALKGAIAAFAEFDLMGDEVPNAKPRDSGRHGTHTAGTIAGRPVSKNAFGIAPKAKLASAMVIEGGQVIDRILAGLDWIVAQGCRILSMSLGLRGFTPAFQTVIDAIRNAGVLPIVAIGNEGAFTSRSPGNYSNVISVGAIDRFDRIAEFSSSQQFDRPNNALVPGLVGPGVAVVSCVPGDAYAEMDGTSMATPHIAGLAALLLQAKPTATIEELENAILDSCRRPSAISEARGNRGIPDAVSAFKLLTGNDLQAQHITGRRRTPKSRQRSTTGKQAPRQASTARRIR